MKRALPLQWLDIRLCRAVQCSAVLAGAAASYGCSLGAFTSSWREWQSRAVWPTMPAASPGVLQAVEAVVGVTMRCRGSFDVP